MSEEDKVYGLIVQAQEMQRFALEFRGTAQDAVRRLPEAARDAVRDATREILVEGAEKASRGILEASRGAIEAAAELRGAQTTALLKHVACLVLVAAVIVAVLYIGPGWLIQNRLAEAHRLQAQVAALEKRAADFAARAGKATLSTCDGRPCIRIDEKAPGYNVGGVGDYRVIFGY